MTQRTDRLDSQIQQELMELLQREMKDPRLGFATVTRVATSPRPGPRPRLRERLRQRGGARTLDVRARGRSAVAATQAGRAAHDAAPCPSCALRRDDSIEAGDRVLKLLREIEEQRDGRPS